MPQDNEFGMTEFKFPHELEEEKNVSVSAEEDRIEIEIEDDTPEQDRGREPMPVEAYSQPFEQPNSGKIHFELCIIAAANGSRFGCRYLNV